MPDPPIIDVPETDGKTPMEIRELIYGPTDIQKAILERFPEAKFEDARDWIHDERFLVVIPSATRREFFRFAVKEGIALICLGIQVEIYQPPAWMKEELEILKAERMEKEGECEETTGTAPEKGPPST